MKYLDRLLLAILLFLILTGGVLTILYLSYNKEIKTLTDKDRKNTTGSYIKLSKGITHYQLGGPDTGKVVVLIHGSSVPYFIWDGTYEYLVKQGFRVLRYDQYGRGYSDRPDVVYNKQLYFNQLIELIDRLHLQTPVNIAGISFGGMLATDFTCAYPNLVNKVILVDPGYPYEAPSVTPLVANYKEAISGDDRANGQLEDFYYPGRHPEWVKQYLPQMAYKGFRRAIISTSFNYQYNGRESNTCLNSKHKKVLLIWGRQDKTVPFTYSDSVLSVLKTEFLPVDKAGHLPYLDQPGIVNPALVTFLRK